MPSERRWSSSAVPRQVGKTKFALGFLGKDADETHPAYFHWEHPSVPPRLRRQPVRELLLALDEIHKYARWKNLFKGIYHTEKSRRKILVTISAGFENLVASQLLKYCHWIEDTEGYSMDLRYLRDTDKREGDFVVLRGRKPLFAVECKSGEKHVGPAVRYFAERTAIPHFYQTHLGERYLSTGKVTVVPFVPLCEDLELP